MNQHPEQMAREMIDTALEAAGWVVQEMRRVNLSAGMGVVVKEYRTDVGPPDYVLFVDGRPVGVIEAKREEEALRLTEVEEHLDITWLKGKSLADLDNLPDPDVLAEEIIENLEAGLESFRAVLAGLAKA